MPTPNATAIATSGRRSVSFEITNAPATTRHAILRVGGGIISSNKRGNVMRVCVMSASYTPLRLLKIIGEHDVVGSRDDHTAVGETLGFPSVAEGKNTLRPAPKFLALISTAPDGC
jgi:hypothetical protein